MFDCTSLSAPIPRRSFLHAGLAGAVSYAAPSFLRASASDRDVPRSDIRCILLWLDGGPSHLDTFDPKPDAPSEIRGLSTAIESNVPGICFAHSLPRLAAIADKLCIIRSLSHDLDSHSQAARYMLTGTASRGCLRPPPVSDLPPRPDTTEGSLYGHTPIGRRLLHCRRLIESGARFVICTCAGWDHHINISKALNSQLPPFDQALAALITDLARRGLLDSTLLVVMGEFGRTPEINGDGGRDHWPHAMSVLLAGGGIRGGQVIGATDHTGRFPADRPIRPEDLVASLSARLGFLPAPILATEDPTPDITGHLIPRLFA